MLMTKEPYWYKVNGNGLYNYRSGMCARKLAVNLFEPISKGLRTSLPVLCISTQFVSWLVDYGDLYLVIFTAKLLINKCNGFLKQLYLATETRNKSSFTVVIKNSVQFWIDIYSRYQYWYNTLTPIRTLIHSTFWNEKKKHLFTKMLTFVLTKTSLICNHFLLLITMIFVTAY